MKTENLIIIGSGPAGYTAALYASREGFEPLLISGFNRGGQLMLTGIIDNYPGFPEGIDGPKLMELMRAQAARFGTRFIDDDVTDIDLKKRPFEVSVGDQRYHAESVIISTGASAQWLGLESEKRLIGRGVSSCGTCDGPLFKGKDVVVVGGGDTAMEDSLFIAKFARSVTIIHRRDKFRASKIMQDRVLSHERIKVVWNSAVEEVLGTDRVTGARIKDMITGKSGELKADGLFVAIGHTPNTGFLKGKLELDARGYIVTNEEVKTEIEGVFAAGDVVDHVYRQAVSAAGSGAKAALEVRAYLQRMSKKQA
jgi:thioredoxin reductase (NADPH)